MKINRLQQVYGYAICCLAVVAALSTIRSFAARAGTWHEPPFTSMASTDTVMYPEDMRVQVEVERLKNLQREYEDARSALNARSNNVEIAASSLIVLLSLALFVFHWRWLQAGSRSE